MDVNRISGYIPGKMVFFLMQVASALAACVASNACFTLARLPPVLGTLANEQQSHSDSCIISTKLSWTPYHCCHCVLACGSLSGAGVQSRVA